ncbi:peptidase [Actinomadura graeca]|uniref:Peptidase n=1 Tax=Actinomadura graeca TaxID=2750812 RepID=A0ABX8QTP0_9ACTN|nr:PepSY domain-containing protein [Actinomadura graeca]QXJ22191.1 peptidase [Actinomadura graeca]
MIALTGCSGEDKKAADAGQSTTAQTGTSGGQETGGGGVKPKETPLTGRLAAQATKAALAAYPGQVLKAEYDAERPGLYAVEIRQKTGTTVEVYLDKAFKVVGTKDEDKQPDNDGD